MLALATSIKVRAKIDDKSHVFWDVDFERILEVFWKGFGRPKSSIFAFFSMFFRCDFSSAVREPKIVPTWLAPVGVGTLAREKCSEPDPPTRVYLIY